MDNKTIGDITFCITIVALSIVYVYYKIKTKE